jgi:hypothetical protein
MKPLLFSRKRYDFVPQLTLIDPRLITSRVSNIDRVANLTQKV